MNIIGSQKVHELAGNSLFITYYSLSKHKQSFNSNTTYTHHSFKYPNFNIKIPENEHNRFLKVHKFAGKSPFIFLIIPLSTLTRHIPIASLNIQISVKIPENEHNRFPKGPRIGR